MTLATTGAVSRVVAAFALGAVVAFAIELFRPHRGVSGPSVADARVRPVLAARSRV